MSNAITNPLGLPAQGGSAWHPDGWVPGDDDNPRLDEAIEARADEIMDDEDAALEPLMQDAIEQTPIRESVASLFRAIEAYRSGRVPAGYAQTCAFNAAQCLYDDMRDIALANAREELRR